MQLARTPSVVPLGNWRPKKIMVSEVLMVPLPSVSAIPVGINTLANQFALLYPVVCMAKFMNGQQVLMVSSLL